MGCAKGQKEMAGSPRWTIPKPNDKGFAEFFLKVGLQDGGNRKKEFSGKRKNRGGKKKG